MDEEKPEYIPQEEAALKEFIELVVEATENVINDDLIACEDGNGSTSPEAPRT